IGSDGTAIAGMDYLGVTNTLTFPEGETLLVVPVPIINDNIVEPNETVNLALLNPTGGAELGPQPTADLIIVDNDSSIGFSSPSFSVSENIATGNATINVVRRGATNESVTVDYATIFGGTATAGQDYLDTSGQLVFAPGETTKSFTVSIKDDNLVEGNETVLLQLTNPTGSAQLDLATATLTIVDNDFAAGILRFSSPVYTISEKGTNAVISVTRTNGSTGVVSVNYTTADGTARAGIKYMSVSGTLAFADGETSKSFLVPIIDENMVEGDKSVNLILSNATGGAVLGSPSTATLLIIDDDFGAGSVDASFDPGNGANYAIRSLALQPDGKVLLGGAFTMFNGASHNYVARLNSDGSVDPGFRGTGASGLVSAVALQDNGKVVMAGAFDSVGNLASQKWVGRLNTDGTTDAGFVPPVAINAAVYAVSSLSAEKNLIGGAFTTAGGGVARLNSNGSLDVSFNAGAGVNVAVFTLATQSDGASIVGGNFTEVNGVPRNRIARLEADGSLDPTFADASLNASAGANGVVYVAILQPDGKVIIGGDFTQIDGRSRNRIARLNADGSLDPSFNPGAGMNKTAFALAVQPDGKVYVGGDFTTVNGVDRNRIARLNRDGSLDASFDPGTGADNSVYAILLQVDGKILVGGGFSTLNGARRNGIARLLGDAEVKGLIGSVTRLATGPFHLVLNVQPQVPYAIQASTNLEDWMGIATNTPTGLTWEFTDANAPTSGARYYRAVRLDPLLTSFRMLDTGGLLLSFLVQPGRTYLLTASSNLSDWMPLSTNTASGPVWNYLDSTASGPNARYYRATLLPP
ncbi:MAG: hypothetical protein M1608_06500, partial [Candidatus Omnitrophica bacterium]|nr:hypothetical protein [Candidatus Omnitrophota bacterium]